MQNYSPLHMMEWAASVLETADVPAEDAKATARFLVRSDLRGYRTHGLTRLASYMERLKTGDFKARPNIAFQRTGAVWHVDADGALGQVAGRRVLDAALPFLADAPMLWVSFHDAGHLGALGVFALEAAESGAICFMGQRAPPLLGLPGFTRPAIGNNPFAFASPAGNGIAPLVFDMACSVAARGHILMAKREGQSIPEGWALDGDGQPTTDANAAASGMLQPAGGYKGMGLAMMVECLAAGLSATAASNASPVMKIPASGAVPRQDAFMFFLNPAIAANGTHFGEYMRHWMNHYRQSGEGLAHIPGERGGVQEREGWATGLAYSPILQAELKSLGDRVGVPLANSI